MGWEGQGYIALMPFSWWIGVKFVAGKILWGWDRVMGAWNGMGGAGIYCLDAIQLVDWCQVCSR